MKKQQDFSSWEHKVDKAHAPLLQQFLTTCDAFGAQVRCVEVWRENQLLVRYARQPYSCRQTHEMYSISKSFTATAVGLAVDRGLLHTTDRVADLFADKMPQSPSENLLEMQLHHLLCMNTGHAQCTMPLVGFAPDAERCFLQQPVAYKPGTHFTYDTAATYMLAAAVQRATGHTVHDWLATQLWGAMEIDATQWGTCTDNTCQGGVGLQASCSDLAKLGLLYLNEGNWNGRQLLSKEWIKQAVRPHSATEQNGTADWTSGYGYQFWRNQAGGYRADGAFGQFCVILPEQQTVTVVTAESACAWQELDCLMEFTHQVCSTPCCGENTAQVFGYEPLQVAQPYAALDTGLLPCLPNPLGVTFMRYLQTKEEMRLMFLDGTEAQTITATGGAWTVNEWKVCALQPTIVRMMPTTRKRRMQFAASCSNTAEGPVMEWRFLNVPHTLRVKVALTERLLTLAFETDLDVLKQEAKQLKACRVLL